MVKFDVERQLMCIERTNGETLELNYMSWNNGKYKYDLRRWSKDNQPLKGVTLSEEDAIELSKTLYEEFVASESEEPEEENLIIDFRSFMIHDNNIACQNAGHSLEKVKAIVYVHTHIGTTKEVAVDATYCRECKCYYINEHDYHQLKEKGHILCQVVSQKQYHQYKNNQMNNQLNIESQLHQIGYNVSSGMTDKERQVILSYAIESKLMTKKEVINHLSFLIRLNESKGISALDLWKKDRTFLTGYEEGKVRLVGVKYFLK